MSSHLSPREIRSNANLTIGQNIFDRLDANEQTDDVNDVLRNVHDNNLREGFRTIFGKHGSNDVNNNVQLGLIKGGNIYKNIFCVESYFAMFRIDDWWH